MPPCSRTSLIVVPVMAPPAPHSIRCDRGPTAPGRRRWLAPRGEESEAWPRRSGYDRISMAKLIVEGFPAVEIETGKRLVLAIEQDAGVDILHACGGNARCTTCRVEFIAGEPEKMTAAERNVLAAKGVTGVRLSCQILCDHDMTVRAVSRLAGSGRADAGGTPSAEIEPPPVWTSAAQ